MKRRHKCKLLAKRNDDLLSSFCENRHIEYNSFGRFSPWVFEVLYRKSVNHARKQKIYTRKRHNPFIVPVTVAKVTGTKGCRGDHRPRQWHKMSFTSEKVTQRTSLRGGVLRFCLNIVEIICVRTISVQKVVLRHLCICFAISRGA